MALPVESNHWSPPKLPHRPGAKILKHWKPKPAHLEDDPIRALDEASGGLRSLADLLIHSRAENGSWSELWQGLDSQYAPGFAIAVLANRAQIDQALHRPEEMQKALNALFRFGGALQTAPGFPLHRSYEYCTESAHRLVEVGIDSGTMTDGNLRECILEFLKMDPIRAFVWALETDSAYIREHLEKEIGNPSYLRGQSWGAGWQERAYTFRMRVEASRRAWWREKQMFLENAQSELLARFNVEQQRWFPDGKAFDSAVFNFWHFDRISMAQTRFSAHRAVFHHAQNGMAALACALELRRREFGEYPARLEDLVPSFIPRLPHDPASGRPFIYRQQGDGSYLLYSVGIDGIDQGAPEDFRDRQASEPDWRWYAPTLGCGARP